MNQYINQLIQYGIDHQLILDEDKDYSANLIIDLLQLTSFEYQKQTQHLQDCSEVLHHLLDYAVEHNIIEDNMTSRDLFDTKIMNCLMPRPSEVTRQFFQKYQKSSQEATDYFYQLSIDSQYIRKQRTDKNIRFQHFYKYGNFEITINLSKPEKDPKEIAKAKLVKSAGYPQCLLCKENVGFAGNYNHPARQNHRIIPLELDNHQYYLQYSPYVYYNEHCIVFNEEHTPMVINKETFKRLLSFVKQFPHYMLGSNADLPIVGGSILTHDHFQGGNYTFPIEGAEVIETIYLESFPKVKIEVLKWPLSSLRLTSTSSDDIVELADHVLHQWIDFSDEKLDIISHSDGVRHNTITPIARMKDGMYQMDLVLRNNRTSEEYPDGIFHPHQNLHHVKKENIGLIEVMGLAVLPARLKEEMEILKNALLGKDSLDKYSNMDKHQLWYQEIKDTYDIEEGNIDTILNDALTKKFVAVLEDAGVFKMNDVGIDSFISFTKSLDSKEMTK